MTATNTLLHFNMIKIVSLTQCVNEPTNTLLHFNIIKIVSLTHCVNEPLCRNISVILPIWVQKAGHDANGYVH